MKNGQKDKIFEILKKHPEGLTLQRISKITNMSRITATKYVHELIGEGRVYQRQVGVAKLCYVKERFLNIVNQEEVLEKLRKKMS